MSDGKTGGFWQTLPGVLTAVAAVLAALGGLIGGLHQAGLLERQKLVVQDDERKPDGPGPVVPSIPATTDIDLLSDENGGHIVRATSENWELAIDGTEATVGHVAGYEDAWAIFGFEGDRPGTFGRFAVLIPDNDRSNPKRIELLVSDALSGPFRSLGSFETQNARNFENPYQDFVFEPVTSRYLQVRIRSAHDDDRTANMTEFQLWGRLADAAP
jgi:hypothetical protein